MKETRNENRFLLLEEMNHLPESGGVPHADEGGDSLS
jgi:hypothetical protein